MGIAEHYLAEERAVLQKVVGRLNTALLHNGTRGDVETRSGRCGYERELLAFELVKGIAVAVLVVSGLVGRDANAAVVASAVERSVFIAVGESGLHSIVL